MAFFGEIMSDIPANLLYTKDDEWLIVDGDIATLGITDYAQNALSDIVFLELPEVGDAVEAEAVFGVVESVKAAADLLSPVDGEIVATNEGLLDEPELINEDPYEGSWLVKIKVSDATQLEGLMNAEAYTAYCESR